MKRRALLICVLSVGFNVSTAWASDPVQPPKLTREARLEKAIKMVDAKLSYIKAQKVYAKNPQAGSADILSGLSLEWFKSQVAVSTSKEEAMKAASEYLERETSNDPAPKRAP